MTFQSTGAQFHIQVIFANNRDNIYLISLVKKYVSFQLEFSDSPSARTAWSRDLLSGL